jgi:hypothetical protein
VTKEDLEQALREKQFKLPSFDMGKNLDLDRGLQDLKREMDSMNKTIHMRLGS